MTQIGTIIHGTLRNEDLLDAFASELESITQHVVGPAKSELAKLIAEARECDPDGDEASDIIDELQDALGIYAPPYCYFGTTEGDGSDFGFWPAMESIDDLPRVESSDEARELGEDCAFVNDHGNVTVFGADGSVLLELV